MKVFAMLADGTEEGELLNVVDILRRAQIDTSIVSVSGRTAESSHGVKIVADHTLDEVDLTDCNLIFVPGGMPGSTRLGECEKLIDAISTLLASGKRVAAICAAPAVVLGAHGFLEGKRATCFPGFEKYMHGARVTGERVVTDGQITTARGLGCAIDLGLELVSLLLGRQAAERIKEKIQY